ncbi:MAG TPA: phospholipase D-like domain-containing protein [Pyrinomonadaceae bacterium]|nr:phospholipase D-like domain-containing protein [Pyrinomonadaceae bacterium]
MDSNTFLVIACIAIVAQSLLLFLALFEPGLNYKIAQPASCPPDSEEFMRIIEALTDAQVTRHSSIEVFTNGENYYEAELEALRRAERNINLEAYIFQKGKVADEFVKVLTERARAGVQVNLVLDAIGSFASWDSYFAELRAVGGRVCWYHPFRWYTLPRINNRTHRELIIIDGRVGFIGGAGFADHWRYPVKDHPRWRDTMFRVEGTAVANLQATFAENWLEASGEILAHKDYFPDDDPQGQTPSLVVNSSPSAGRSTRARILFQMLLASAEESVLVTTPYFLPDRSARAEMVRAIRERGVKIQIVVPGIKSDHALTRNSSRRLYGDLLEAGASIYEYQPTMMHAKTLVVDGKWSVIGSTNFDNRSFGLNDEVNLAAFDTALAARIAEDFERDRAESKAVSYEEWRRRSIFERIHELFGMLLERQQ